MTINGNFDVYVYHDHSTEEILFLFNKMSSELGQCNYNGNTCVACQSNFYRVVDNSCVENIQNCSAYSGAKCISCQSNAILTNGICI